MSCIRLDTDLELVVDNNQPQYTIEGFILFAWENAGTALDFLVHETNVDPRNVNPYDAIQCCISEWNSTNFTTEIKDSWREEVLEASPTTREWWRNNWRSQFNWRLEDEKDRQYDNIRTDFNTITNINDNDYHNHQIALLCGGVCDMDIG